jgi:hypothetical protein
MADHRRHPGSRTHHPWVVGPSPTRPSNRQYTGTRVFVGDWEITDIARVEAEAVVGGALISADRQFSVCGGALMAADRMLYNGG